VAKDEQIRIDLEAKDNASATIDDVADVAADLEKLSPEIEVTADAGAARSDIAAVSDDAAALSAQDAEIVLRAKVDAAKADLAGLQAELKTTGERAEDTNRQLDRIGGDTGGISTRGNAIADLTGPLGEASGAASDFAGVFDGLGDIASDAASKLGASAGATAALSGVVGGLGIAVAAGAAAWSMFSASQKKAREEAEKQLKVTKDLTKAIKDGDAAAATTAFRELYGDALDDATAAGLSIKQTTAFIMGQDAAAADLADRVASLTTAYDKEAGARAKATAAGENLTTATEAELRTAKERLASLTDAQKRYADNNLTIEEQADLERELAAALGVTTKATDDVAAASRDAKRDVDLLGQGFDAMRGKLDFDQAALNFAAAFNYANGRVMAGTALTSQEILDLKNDYLAVAEEVGLNPVQVRSDLQKIDDGDIAEVLFATQQAINNKPAITAKLKLELERNAFVVTGAGGGKAFSVVPATNVTVNLPRGYRENDVIAAGQRAARRSGGLYNRVRR
jgi:hypothetical protein